MAITTLARLLARISAGVTCLLLSTSVLAADLAEVYQSALANDPVLGAAKAGYAATEQLIPQTRSRLLPSITGSGFTTNTDRSFPLTFVDENSTSPTFGQEVGIPSLAFNEHSYQFQLTQSIVNLPSWFEYTGSKATVEAARFNKDATAQNLILRVIIAYLDVLRIQDQLDSTLAEEAAVKRQLEQVQQRFDVGLVAITDVLESQAVYDNTVVRRIQAVGDHDIFFETLRTLTDVPYDSLARLSQQLPIVNPEPITEETWVQTALATNLGIRAANSQLVAARRTVRARKAGSLPTIEATATRSTFVSGGQTVFGGSGIEVDDTVYGLRLNLPIFTGGFNTARTREARALELQSREQLSEQQLVVSRDTRNLFRAVATDVVRVRARLKAIKSAESALEATETGYEVGTRNIVDVLQAQQRLFSSQFDYADSRYNYVVNLIALKRAAGTLVDEDLFELNTFTDPNDPVNRISAASLLAPN